MSASSKANVTLARRDGGGRGSAETAAVGRNRGRGEIGGLLVLPARGSTLQREGTYCSLPDLPQRDGARTPVPGRLWPFLTPLGLFDSSSDGGRRERHLSGESFPWGFSASGAICSLLGPAAARFSSFQRAQLLQCASATWPFPCVSVHCRAAFLCTACCSVMGTDAIDCD